MNKIFKLLPVALVSLTILANSSYAQTPDEDEGISFDYKHATQQLICFENLYRESAMTIFDAEELNIHVDLSAKTVKAFTQGAWGGTDYGTVNVTSSIDQDPIKTTIKTVSPDGLETDELKITIAGPLPAYSSNVKLSSGAPGEATLRFDTAGKPSVYRTYYVDCFTR